MHLLVTRPEPEASAMAMRLRADGHTVTIEPLLFVEVLNAARLELDGVQALIATSRNAMRSLGVRQELAAARRLTIVAVGPGTAAEARKLGFERILAGPRAARDLLPVIQAVMKPDAGALLHLAGEELAFDLTGALCAAGYSARSAILYRTIAPCRLTPATADELQTGAIDGVILMSPRTATAWSRLLKVERLQDFGVNIIHFCLSQAVSAALPSPMPVRIEVAVQPNLEEMLALVARVAAQSFSHS